MVDAVSVTCCLHSFLALLCLPFVGRTTIEDESRCGRPLGLAIASSTAPYDLLIADSYHGILDSQFLVDASKYFSGILVALSTMMSLELPHVNVLSKMDLVDPKSKKNIDRLVCKAHASTLFSSFL